MKKLQEERRARQEELARKDQEAKLRMAREKTELLALKMAPKRQDPLPPIQEEPAPLSKQPISQEEKDAIAEFLVRKEWEKRRIEMMEKCNQHWIANMQ